MSSKNMKNSAYSDVNVKDTELETILYASLKPEYEPTQELNEQILKRVKESRHKGNKRKKCIVQRIHWGAVAALACVLILSVGSVGVASGKLKYIVSSWDKEAQFTSYEDVERAESLAGFRAWIPEEFQNGYAFSSIKLLHMYDIDDDGVKSDRRENLYVTYQMQGEESTDVTLRISGEDETLKSVTVSGYAGDENPAEASGYTTTQTEAGIKMTYYNDTFLFAPKDYEPTEEESDREKTDPHYYIAYGRSDEPTLCTGQTVEFVISGQSYQLQTFDTSVTESELYDMAKEVIEMTE